MNRSENGNMSAFSIIHYTVCFTRKLVHIELHLLRHRCSSLKTTAQYLVLTPLLNFIVQWRKRPHNSYGHQQILLFSLIVLFRDKSLEACSPLAGYKSPCGGGLECLYHSPASHRRRRKENPVPGGITGSPCDRGHINTETWTSRLGVGRKADGPCPEKKLLLPNPKTWKLYDLRDKCCRIF
jgi:hypothetical protein